MATNWDPDDFTEVDPAEVARLIERAYRSLSAAEVSQLIAEGKENALGSQLVPISARLPVVDLNEWQGQPPPRISLWGASWLPVRQATMLSGPGGVGKSLLALNLLASIALGVPFLGMETTRCRCVYITFEDDAEELWRRLDDWCVMQGRPMADLRGWLFIVSLCGETASELAHFARDGEMETTELWEQLRGTVVEHGVRVVAFDNATDAMGGDLNDLHQVASFVNLLTSLAMKMDGAFLILHHPNKAGAEWLGSVAWHNKVRSRWTIEGGDSAADPDARTIKNPKANYGKQGGAIDFRWHSGAFIRDEDLPGDLRDRLAESTAASSANMAFLACLRECTKREQAVSASPSSTFAPSVFEGMPEAKGHKKAALRLAMNRLLTLGQIEAGELDWKRADRHPAKGLREVISDAGDAVGRRAAATRGQRGLGSGKAAEIHAGDAAEIYPSSKEEGAALGPAAPIDDDLDWDEWDPADD